MIALERPIVLAPLAGGPSTPELAAAVSNAGGLGFLGAGYLSVEALEERIHATRALTSKPFAVNLFVVQPNDVDEDELRRYLATIEGPLGEPRFDDDALDGKLDLLVAERVPVVSTTFGRLDGARIDDLRGAGIELWETATTPAEAAACTGDVVVLQGSEAGGHRGSFTDTEDDYTLDELLAAVQGVQTVATGGIATRKRVAEVLAAGALAAQVGTAFLLCPEAGTSEPHRRALREQRETAITRAFTGRRARGLVNDFMRAHPDAPTAYPQINHATAPLRAAARAAGDAEAINLWAGTAYRQARDLPAADVVALLTPEGPFGP